MTSWSILTVTPLLKSSRRRHFCGEIRKDRTSMILKVSIHCLNVTNLIDQSPVAWHHFRKDAGSGTMKTNELKTGYDVCQNSDRVLCHFMCWWSSAIKRPFVLPSQLSDLLHLVIIFFFFFFFHNLRKIFAAEIKFTKFGGKKPPATQTLSFTPFWYYLEMLCCEMTKLMLQSDQVTHF